MSIEFRNVGYTYLKKTPFERKVLHDISFKINSGEFISIIGHTGSGKSTLIQLIGMLLKDFEGDILIDSLNVNDRKIRKSNIRRKFGFSFQYPEYQFFEDTIYKDISFSLKVRGESDDVIRDKVKDAMKMVSLDYSKYKDRNPFDISGGEKRKVSLASILVLDPKYIILDEPTVGLDPQSVEEITNIIENLNKNFDKTIIVVTHIMDFVHRLSDRVMLLDKGRIVDFNTPCELFMNDRVCDEYSIDRPYLVKLFLELKNRGIDLKNCSRNIRDMENLLVDYFNKRGRND